MAWRKHFKTVQLDNNPGTRSPLGSTRGKAGPARQNYSSFLPDVYSGSPNRIERLNQYETMDWDSEVNAALDILAEFTTQRNKENQTPFTLYFKNRATNAEVTILKECLQQWTNLQEFNTRMFRIARNTFKYGDTFFIRDPETLKWFYVDPAKVVRIIVNESDGKKPEQYVIRDLNINFEELVVTQINPSIQHPNAVSNNVQGGNAGRGMTGAFPQQHGNRFSLSQGEYAIDASHVIHLSLSEGLDNNYPFGNSLLESVFKVYKQKELLEDAIIIYRVQRAPERRVFYIDVGNMPSHLAMSFVERVKNEIHQRRIPSASGGSSSVIDSSYNPLSIGEDFYFPHTCLDLETKIPLLDGRVLTLNEIIEEYKDGKKNWTYGLSNITHEMEPAEITWAGVTRRNAKVLEVLLDTGEKVIATPDHRFIMRDGSEVEAQCLKSGDSLMPLHKTDVNVVSVTELDYVLDTGDITVKSESDSHWFGLASGIYVHNSEGRGSKVETLPGGSSLGEIDDLRYFTNKLMRALRIPSSYLPTGADDSQGQYNDGRVGTAYIQELRFNKYCERLQQLLIGHFDREFKKYLSDKGVNIDFSLFDLKFQSPQNFASYRQAELDNQRIGTFGQIVALPFISKRFALKRFLGMTEEDIAENERLWSEENGGDAPLPTDASSELRSAGITPSGIEADVSSAEGEAEVEMPPPDETPQ